MFTTRFSLPSNTVHSIMNIFKKKKELEVKRKSSTSALEIKRKSSGAPAPDVNDRNYTQVPAIDPLLALLDEEDSYISSGKFLKMSSTGEEKEAVLVLCDNSLYKLTDDPNKLKKVLSMSDETPSRKITRGVLTPTSASSLDADRRFEGTESTEFTVTINSNIATGISVSLQTKLRVSWLMPLQFVYSVRSDPEDDRTFSIASFVSKKEKVSTIKKYICSSSMERDEWVLIFHRVLQDFSQRYFEDRVGIIPESEVYQHHFFTKNANKNVRCIVFSNKKMYYVKMQQGEADKKNVQVRWAAPYSVFSSLVQKGADTIIVKFDKNELVKDKSTKGLELINSFTPDVEDLQNTLQEIRRLYFWATHKPIRDEYMA
jgi:hypothetical protein